MARNRDPSRETGTDDLASAVLTASRVLVAVSARSIAGIEERLTLTQFRTLVVLDGPGDPTLSGLADDVGVTASTALRTVDRLVDLGLVERGGNPADRRQVLLRLTPEGARVVAEVTTRRHQEISRIVDRMPTTQQARLVSALQSFAAAAEEPPATGNW